MYLTQLLVSSVFALFISMTAAYAADQPAKTPPVAAKKAEATPTPGVKKIENEGEKSDTKVKQPKLKKPDELKK